MKKLFKSVSVRKSNLKFCTVTFTKDSHQMTKNQISVAETLKIVGAKSVSPRTLRSFYLLVKSMKNLLIIVVLITLKIAAIFLFVV